MERRTETSDTQSNFPLQPAETILSGLVLLGVFFRYLSGDSKGLIFIPFVMLGVFHFLLGWYLYKDSQTEATDYRVTLSFGIGAILMVGSHYLPALSWELLIAAGTFWVFSMVTSFYQQMHGAIGYARFYRIMLLRGALFAALFGLVRFL